MWPTTVIHRSDRTFWSDYACPERDRRMPRGPRVACHVATQRGVPTDKTNGGGLDNGAKVLPKSSLGIRINPLVTMVQSHDIGHWLKGSQGVSVRYQVIRKINQLENSKNYKKYYVNHQKIYTIK